MSVPPPDHKPIEPQYHLMMMALAEAIDAALNGEDCKAGDKKTGFFLTVFAFSEPSHFNYISNADKIDVRAMLKGVTARIEGRLQKEART